MIFRIDRNLASHSFQVRRCYQKERLLGTSLVVQWLRLNLPMQGVWVQSLVGELRSHTPHGQKTKNIKQKQYCNNFNKDFKNGPHAKKNLKKKQRRELSLNHCAWAMGPRKGDRKLGKSIRWTSLWRFRQQEETKWGRWSILILLYILSS